MSPANPFNMTEAEEWQAMAADCEDMGRRDLAIQCRLMSAQAAREADARRFMEAMFAASKGDQTNER